MAEEYVVSIAAQEEPDSGSAIGALGVVWYELSGGIGLGVHCVHYLLYSSH